MRRRCLPLVLLVLAKSAAAEGGIEATVPIRAPLVVVAEISEECYVPGVSAWAAGVTLEGRALSAAARLRGERGEGPSLELSVARNLSAALTLAVLAEGDGTDRQLGLSLSWSF
jgi:hypothetical protein